MCYSTTVSSPMRTTTATAKPQHRLRWNSIDEFKSGSIHAFEVSRTERIVFSQDLADGNEHILLIDEITIDDAGAAAPSTSERAALPAQQNVWAKGYERHVDVRWDSVVAPELRRYVIYGSFQGGEFKPVGIEAPGINRFTDYLGKPGLTARYKVAASDREYRLSSIVTLRYE